MCEPRGSRWVSSTAAGLECLNNPYGLFNPHTKDGLLDQNNLDGTRHSVLLNSLSTQWNKSEKWNGTSSFIFLHLFDDCFVSLVKWSRLNERFITYYNYFMFTVLKALCSFKSFELFFIFIECWIILIMYNYSLFLTVSYLLSVTLTSVLLYKSE